MTALFGRVAAMSAAAGILVLVVLLLRLALRRAPRWTHVLLWGLVAVRLVFPFSLASPLSLMPDTYRIVREIAPGTPSGAVPDVPSGEISSVLPAAGDPLPVSPAEADAGNGENVGVTEILAVAWLVGIAVMLAYMIFGTLRVYRRVRDAVPVRDNIYVCVGVDSPFVFGVLRPRICLPEGMTERDARCVAAHETAHIRRGDYIWKPFGFLLLAAHWFNPLIWLGYVFFCRDIEAACDERVVRGRDAAARADYSEALLAYSGMRPRLTAYPPAFGETGVKARIRAVLRYRKPAAWIAALSLLACAAAAVFFLTDPIRDPAIPPVTEDEQPPAVAAVPETEPPAGVSDAGTDTAQGPEELSEQNELPDEYFFRLAWHDAAAFAESENIGILCSAPFINVLHSYDWGTVWVIYLGVTDGGWDDRFITVTLERGGGDEYAVGDMSVSRHSEVRERNRRVLVRNCFVSIEEHMIADPARYHGEAILELSAYRRMLAYGADSILAYVFGEFSADGQTGVCGEALMRVMADQLGAAALPLREAKSGQEYFARWLAYTASDDGQPVRDWLAANAPAAARLLFPDGE